MAEITKKSDIGLSAILACVYFLALPLTITVNETGSSFLKILTIPIAAYLFVSLIFYKDKMELNYVHLFSALLLVSALLTLFAEHSTDSIEHVVGYFETIALLFVVTVRRYTKKEIELFEITQIILYIIMIFLGFVGADWYGDRNTMTLFGSVSDPNYFCGLFILPTATALKKLGENKFYNVLCPILVFLGAYLVFTSGSRGGLLAFSVTIIAYVFISAKNIKQIIVGVIVFVLAAIIVWNIVIPILPEKVSARFDMQELISSRGTHRGDIWISMLDTIKNSGMELFSGRGINARHEMMFEGDMVAVAAHNQIIQALYNQGVFGLVVYVLLAFCAVVRNIKKRGYISAAMMGMIALTMTLSLNPSIKSFWNLLIYTAISFENVQKNEGVECA